MYLNHLKHGFTVRIIAFLFPLLLLSPLQVMAPAAHADSKWDACPNFSAFPHGDIVATSWVSPAQDETVEGQFDIRIHFSNLKGVKAATCLQITASYPGGPNPYIIVCKVLDPTPGDISCPFDPSKVGFPSGVVIVSYDFTNGQVAQFAPNGQHWLSWKQSEFDPLWIGIIIGLIIGAIIGGLAGSNARNFRRGL